MSDSALKLRITEAMKTAMRAKDAAQLGTIRLILAAIKQIEVDERIQPDDTRILAVLDKMIKQRRDSLSQFEQAKRQDLADKEAEEIKVLQTFMPQALTPEEIGNLIRAAIAQSGAASVQDMGKVMGLLKPQVQGRADMGQVGQWVRQALSAAV